MFRNSLYFFAAAAVLLLASGCRNRAVRSYSPGFTNLVTVAPEPVEKVRDTVWYERKWKDPDTYVMGRPSAKQIADWKKACEEKNSRFNRFEVQEYMEPVESYVAFYDLMSVWMDVEDADIIDDYDFLFWRLNELKPMGKVDGEYAKYCALKQQYHCVFEYTPGPSFEINNAAWLDAEYTMLCGRYYCNRLAQKIPSARVLLRREMETFLQFRAASRKAFKMIVLGDPEFWGSITSMGSYNYSAYVAGRYNNGIIPVFLSLADPQNYPGIDSHITITDEMIDRAYDIFLASIVVDRNYEMEVEEVPEEYTVENLRKVLNEDRSLWKKWMRRRREVSAELPADAKALYDRCTNNVRRDHLIVLLNRYTDYDLREPSYYEALLPRDCSDQMLMEYDYDKAYKKYLE